MGSTAALRFCLVALFVVCGALQTRFSLDAIDELRNWSDLARSPFSVWRRTLIVARPEPEAATAGLREGDRILSVEGRSFRGLADLHVPLRKARAGDPFTVTVRDGETVSILLAGKHDKPAGAGDWIRELVLRAAIPVTCLLLGFWVAALRIRDPIAWLLLVLMLSFSRLTDFGSITEWEGWWRPAGLIYRWSLVNSWAIWMMLFGIYFPERFNVDRRLPWLKWLFIIPVAVPGAARVIIEVGWSENAAAVEALDALTAPVEPIRMVIFMVSISLFFMCLGIKQGMTRQSDVRRRLMLLSVGTSISLMPTFILSLRALFFHREMFDVPEWVLVPSLMSMFLFPMTLAYVIVVHRALDVRVVIRQGLQYALARRGVAVLQGLTLIGVVGWMFVMLSRPGTRRVEILTVLGAGLTFIVLIPRLGKRLQQWIDRRFFREAYDAERILGDLSDQVRTMIETVPLLETVTRRIAESLHVPRVAALVESGGAYQTAVALGFPAAPSARFEAECATVRHLRSASEPVRVHLDDPRSWVNKDSSAGESEKALLRSLDTQVLLPLSANDKLPGFISLGMKQSEEPYSGGDMRMLQSVATQTGLALENSRLTAAVASEVAQRERLNREVEIAREVQERLFPQSLPPIVGLDYRGSCRPALWVGGDYFDFLALPGGRLGIAVGDVSGKGIGAALLMASLQASLRGQTMQGTASLAQTMANVSRLVYDASPENRYATFFYAQYDPDTRVLAYVNAGHCPPMVLRRGGADAPLEVIRLKAGGTVVGLFEQTAFQEASVALRPGDLIVAYTDGISEALDPDEEEWGEDNLIAAAAGCDGLGPAETIQRIMRGADAFAAGAPQHDDMTLVIVRVI